MSEYISTTPLPGVFIIERPLYPDDRGFFQEIYRTEDIGKKLGRPVRPIQGNLSQSYPNVIRGLHAEHMDKMITPLNGRVQVAFADLREDSPTFGQSINYLVDTTAPNAPRRTFFLPDGIANSYCVYGDETILYLYGVSANYDGRPKRTIRFDDPDLAIPWAIDTSKAIISDADRMNMHMREMFPHKYRRRVYVSGHTTVPLTAQP